MQAVITSQKIQTKFAGSSLDNKLGFSAIEDSNQSTEVIDSPEYILSKFILEASTTTQNYRVITTASIYPHSAFDLEDNAPMYAEFHNIIRTFELDFEKDDHEKTDTPLNKMRGWLEEYGDLGIDLLQSYISNSSNNDYIQSELLVSLSEHTSSILYESILKVLAGNLNHSSPKVRYGAIIGISRTGNNFLLKNLQAAKKHEHNVILKNIINKVIKQFKQLPLL